MDITADTTDVELAAVASGDRRSERRRDELQRLANILTRSSLAVRVEFADGGAFAAAADADAAHDFEIHVPTTGYEQVDLDLDEAVWHRRVQLAVLFHELGHVRYSDFERFERRVEEVAPPWRDVFRSLYNAAEDVVVERQMAAEFDLATDFRVLNDTFWQLRERDHERFAELYADGDDPELTYTVFEGLSLGVLESGFGTTSRFPALLDPGVERRGVHDGRRDVLAALAPALSEYVAAMVATADPAARVERGHAFFETARERLAALPHVQSTRVYTAGVRPVEAGTFAVAPPEEAGELPPAGRAAGSQPDAGRRADSDATGGERLGDAGGGARPTLRTDDEAAGSPLAREARALRDAVRAEDNDLSCVRVVEPDTVGAPERWTRAERAATRLERDLRAQLRRRRRGGYRGGHRSGRIDPHRLVQASQGTQRVFRRREPGDERDYSCLVVLDRSGSMRTVVEAAEDATAQLVAALSGVGVDVSVLALLNSYPRLELPFGARPERYAGVLTSRAVGGGTPLSDALTVARERFERGEGTVPLLVVVTDGAPDSVERYREELARCPFPVYGVYLDVAPGSHASFFDRIVYTEPGSVDTTLRGLVRDLVG